jgi:predicted nucleotidyltransferase
MRLLSNEVLAIKESFLEIFTSGSIYLFGSRVDDSKKGGDIDLYIENIQKNNIANKKIDFLISLKRKIGEQKIDVVINRDDNKPIYKIAKKGILLCKN